MSDSYNNIANIYVVNNTGGKAKIWFSHQYSDDTVQRFEPDKDIPSNAAAGPFIVGFRTGFGRNGNDFWFCQVQVLDGPNVGTYATKGTFYNPSKQCTLKSADKDANLYFTVSTSVFYMGEQSGSCSTSMSKSS